MPRLVLFLALATPALLSATVVNYKKLEGCESNYTRCVEPPPPCTATTTTTAPSGTVAPNCSSQFYKCMGNVIEDIRKPKPCYQAETAQETFQTAVSFTVGVLGFTIVSPMIPILIKWIAKKATANERVWIKAQGGFTDEMSTSCCFKVLLFMTPHEEMDPPAQKEGGGGEAAAGSAAANSGPIAAKAADGVLEKMTRAGFAQISAVIGLAFGYVSVGWIFNLWKDWSVQDATCKFCMEARSPTDESVRSCYW